MSCSASRTGRCRLPSEPQKDYAKRESAIGAGWLANAERLLSAEPECVGRYLARIKSVLAFEGKGDCEAALGHTDVGMDIASRFQDSDLLGWEDAR